MKLHWSPRSPFVRKIMIALHEHGLVDKVSCVRSVVAYMATPNEEVLKDNPLGKLPALVLDDGTCLFDSRVICEYLDGLSEGTKLFPNDPKERIRQMRWQALGDGLTDLLLIWRVEQMRPNGSLEVLLDAFERKVRACFTKLEDEADLLAKTQFGIGHVSIVCAIGQLEFRYNDSHWREAFPKLGAWYDEIFKRSSVSVTAPQDDASPATVNPNFDPQKPPVNFLEVLS